MLVPALGDCEKMPLVKCPLPSMRMTDDVTLKDRIEYDIHPRDRRYLYVH